MKVICLEVWFCSSRSTGKADGGFSQIGVLPGQHNWRKEGKRVVIVMDDGNEGNKEGT